MLCGSSMRTQILTKIKRDGSQWVGLAYTKDGAFCKETGLTKTIVNSKLEESINHFLSIYARQWIEAMKHSGNPEIPNCPEGALELPSDVWICKLSKNPCPIQAMVFTMDRDLFIENCLVASPRKEQIFETVKSGKYDGFHHVPGRFLCVECENEQKQTNFKYHYPWEMTHIEDCVPLPPSLTRPSFRILLKKKGLNPSAANNALCAIHCQELAQKLNPAVASGMSIFRTNFKLR